MKISELTEDQLCVIAESNPDWAADYYPDHMADHHSQWMVYHREELMAAIRPATMAAIRPNYGAYGDDIPPYIMALIADVEKESQLWKR